MALNDIFLSSGFGQSKEEKVISSDGSHILTNETVVFVDKDSELTLPEGRYGQHIEFYVDYGCSLRLIGTDTPIYGALVGNHPKVLCNTPVFDISRPCYIKIIHDGTKWRMTGQLND